MSGLRWSVTKALKPFAAAHYLPNHDGPCQHVHGHNYRIEATIEGHEPVPADHQAPDAGMVYEFGRLSDVYDDVIFPLLDHRLINDSIPELPAPTTEMIAAWILTRFRNCGQPVTSVRLWETDANSATVSVSGD